jgi:hypothetical protein
MSAVLVAHSMKIGQYRKQDVIAVPKLAMLIFDLEPDKFKR